MSSDAKLAPVYNCDKVFVFLCVEFVIFLDHSRLDKPERERERWGVSGRDEWVAQNEVSSLLLKAKLWTNG